LMNERITLESQPNSLLKPGGTSLVLHANADDQMTDPSGNSGDRIACGIIVK
jgi:superoxide dismutase, Cu-Zn family